MKQSRRFLISGAFLAVIAAGSVPGVGQAPLRENTETILATYRVKAEELPAFLKLMPEYWKALRAHRLVRAEPYVLLQSEEDGKPVFYEVFSWKDHAVAHHVPAEIQGYWDKLNAMVEKRGGHEGIEFPEVRIVPAKP